MKITQQVQRRRNEFKNRIMAVEAKRYARSENAMFSSVNPKMVYEDKRSASCKKRRDSSQRVHTDFSNSIMQRRYCLFSMGAFSGWPKTSLSTAHQKFLSFTDTENQPWISMIKDD